MINECTANGGAAPSPTNPAPAPAPTPTTSGLWYPDWAGSNDGCIADGNEPDYMAQNPTLWMYSTLSECCEMNYSWTMKTCDPSGSSGSSSSSQWCMSWTQNKCVQSCETWDWKFATQSECCNERMWWDTSGCLA
jgi:hypothetical protein